MKNEKETLKLKVHGHVQGVGFRNACKRHAHLHGVQGWVSNAQDGTVDVVLQGNPDQVDRMLSWLVQGPAGAQVAEIEQEILYTGIFYDRFEIR